MEYWDTQGQFTKAPIHLVTFPTSIAMVDSVAQTSGTNKEDGRARGQRRLRTKFRLPPPSSRNSILQMIGQKWYSKFKRWAKCATAVVSTTKDIWSNYWAVFVLQSTTLDPIVVSRQNFLSPQLFQDSFFKVHPISLFGYNQLYKVLEKDPRGSKVLGRCN